MHFSLRCSAFDHVDQFPQYSPASMLQTRQSGSRRTLRSSSSSWYTLYAAGSALLAFASLILHAPVVASAAPTKLDMHAGTQLTPDNFQETIRDGIWLVEHYSPFCHHCKAFVPTWRELVESRKHQEESINFHFGQVDCAVYGDLCDKNNVKGYPAIFLYENGEYVEAYKKERSSVRMNKWLDDRLPDEPKEEEAVKPEGGSEVDDDTAEDPAPVRNAEDESEKTTAEAMRTAAAGAQEQALAAGEGAHHAAQTTGNTGAVEAHATNTAVDEGRPIAAQMHDANKEADSLPLLRVQQHHKRVTPNPEGQVQHLKTSELNALLSPESAQGPVFVKFYAPWCSHCKRLAPTWKDLAHALQNRVNVVEFNCDASENKVKCRQEGITGYPTLVFYQGGEKAEYSGGRSLAQMEAFANKAALATGMRDIDPSDLQDIAQEDEVYFLYLYPSDTPASEVDLVQTAASTLMGTAPVFKSSSPDLFAQLNFPQTHPSLLVFKDHEVTPIDSMNFTQLHSTSTSSDRQESQRKQAERDVSAWLHGKKHPFLTELTGINFKDYMEDGQGRAESYVAVAALNPEILGANAMRKHQDELRQTARAWHQAMKVVNPEAKPVNFVWVDGDKWGKYLQATYAIRPNRPEPLLIITDPAWEKFYPTDMNSQSIRIDQDQIFRALENLYDGRLPAKRTTSMIERASRIAFGRLTHLGVYIGDHPYVSIIFGVVLFMTMFGMLIYFMDNEELRNRGKVPQAPPHQPKYVHNEKSLYAQSHNSAGVKKD